MGGLEGGDGCRVTRGEQNEAVIIIPTPVRGGESLISTLSFSPCLCLSLRQGGAISRKSIAVNCVGLRLPDRRAIRPFQTNISAHSHATIDRNLSKLPKLQREIVQ